MRTKRRINVSMLKRFTIQRWSAFAVLEWKYSWKCDTIPVCRDWHGTPVPRDGEMEELRFFACDEIDLSEISPPIREVVKQYIQKQPRDFRRQESGEKGLIEALRLRPYKRSDAKSIVSWIENEYAFRQC